MKYCAYCGSIVDDSFQVCPYCLGPVSNAVCPRCGNTYAGPFCPDCRERDEAEKAAEQARREREQAEEEENKALVAKTILTVLIPWFGGYFLIREHVKSGYRIFGIVWCCFIAISIGFSSFFPNGYRIVSVLFYLSPNIVYLFRMRKSLLKSGELELKLTLAAVIAILAVSIMGCLVNAS